MEPKDQLINGKSHPISCLKKLRQQITGPHLEHKVDSTSVRGDSHCTACWDRLVGCQRVDGLRIRQGLNLQTVFLHQGHSSRVYALEVAWERQLEPEG